MKKMADLFVANTQIFTSQVPDGTGKTQIVSLYLISDEDGAHLEIITHDQSGAEMFVGIVGEEDVLFLQTALNNPHMFAPNFDDKYKQWEVAFTVVTPETTSRHVIYTHSVEAPTRDEMYQLMGLPPNDRTGDYRIENFYALHIPNDARPQGNMLLWSVSTKWHKEVQRRKSCIS